MTPVPVLFAGPTLARLERIAPPRLDDLELRPPIRRGDIDALLRARPPGVAIVVDGVFHLGQLAVGHHELARALARGWQIWGLSSMGAIRAAEMQGLGMRGFGKVFERFRDDPEFRDDEVTLLHQPTPPYRELSEPLVHLRAALADLVARGEITADAEAALVADLAARWFGERTLLLFRDLIARACLGAERAEGVLRSFDAYRVKAHDLDDFLREAPFRGHTP